MGYSKGTKIIRLVSKYLNEMIEAAPNDKIEWVTNDPTKLGFWLHNAIEASRRRIAEGGPQACEPYLSYARLKGKYIIRKTGTSVIAEPRDITPLEAIRVGMSKIVLDGLVEPLEIVGAAIKHKADEMVFPDASVDVEDLATIFKWTDKNGYKIIGSPVTRGLKLSKYESEDLAWTPNNLKLQETVKSGDQQESISQTFPDTISQLLGLTENSTTSQKDISTSEASTD